jgi:nucleotide-binding universal stress UspA family protein
VWATDGSASADAALPFAKELAAGEGKRLVAVHCNELTTGRAAGYPVLVDESEMVEKIKRQMADLREIGFDASLVVFPGVAGRAAHVIADHAREIGADAIVVGTRGYGPLPGLLVGSVTQRLLHLAPCPILAVPRPEHVGSEEPELEEAAVG